MLFEKIGRNLVRIIEKPRVLSGRLRGLYSNHCFCCLTAADLADRPFKTIIDVGAHEAEFINSARWVFPNAKIYAFEPIKEFYEKIKNIKNVKVYNFGLWEKNDESEVYFNKDNTGSSSFLAPTENYHKEIGKKSDMKIIKASRKRFDSLHIDITRPCYVKIDVEGAEEKVLKGFGERLKEVDVVQIEWFLKEYHKDQMKLSRLMPLLEKYGFGGFVQKEVNLHCGVPSVCDLIFFRTDKI